MSNIKKNILGAVVGFLLTFMNNDNVTKSIDQLFFRINNGDNLSKVSIVASGIIHDLLLGISLFGICVLLFFTMNLLKSLIWEKNN